MKQFVNFDSYQGFNILTISMTKSYYIIIHLLKNTATKKNSEIF